MIRLKQTLLCLAFIFLSAPLIGCSAKVKRSDTNVTVLELTESLLQDLDNAASYANSSSIKQNLEKLSPYESALIKEYAASIQVTSVLPADTESETRYTVTLGVPVVDSLLEGIGTSDTGFTNDYKKLCVTGVEDTVLNDFVLSYVINLLKVNDFTLEEQEFFLDYNPAIKTLVSDKELTRILMSILQVDFSEKAKEIMQTIIESTTESYASSSLDCSVVSVGDSFSTQMGNSAVLVSDMRVVEGESALTTVRALSPVNKYLTLKENCVAHYISYCVENLSSQAVTMQSPFVMLESGRVLCNEGFSIVGLSDLVKLEPKESKRLTSFLVGSPSSELYWYSKGNKVLIKFQ